MLQWVICNHIVEKYCACKSIFIFKKNLIKHVQIFHESNWRIRTNRKLDNQILILTHRYTYKHTEQRTNRKIERKNFQGHLHFLCLIFNLYSVVSLVLIKWTVSSCNLFREAVKKSLLVARPKNYDFATRQHNLTGS